MCSILDKLISLTKHGIVCEVNVLTIILGTGGACITILSTHRLSILIPILSTYRFTYLRFRVGSFNINRIYTPNLPQSERTVLLKKKGYIPTRSTFWALYIWI